MLKIKKHFSWFLVIIIIASLVRLYNFSFPFFNFEEARIASRGYSIATSGKDELNRPFPLIFNSLSDYQLPVVSYITSLGIMFFGKNDFGSRIPFVLASIIIMMLVYKVSAIISDKKEFRLFAVLSLALAPGLIFFSKIPNEFIVLTLSIVLIFYLLTKKKTNILILGLAIILALLTSKLAWFIIIPFVVFSLAFFQADTPRKIKIKIIAISLVLTTAAILIFLQVPQATRSFLENDFSIFQDNDTKVILNRFRGEGLEAGWPNFFEKMFFNKSQMIYLSFFNWLSHLEPAVLFGRFDELRRGGFMTMGAFPKISIFPFILGLIFIIRSNNRKLKALLLIPFILTFPILFIYPKNNYSSILIILPFVALIIALGFLHLNKLLKFSVVFIMIVEVLISICYVIPDIKYTNNTRPIWITPIIEESYKLSQNNRIAISDNIVTDIGPYLTWLSPNSIQGISKGVQSPYKFREVAFPDITILGTDDDAFYTCGADKPVFVIVSKRDYEKLQKNLGIDNEKMLKKIFTDSLNNKIAYLIYLNKCLK